MTENDPGAPNDGSNVPGYNDYGISFNVPADQMQPPALRRAFIDLHYFYRGKYLGTRLVTTRLEESARPRLMTQAEREAFLNTVFAHSLWE